MSKKGFIQAFLLITGVLVISVGIVVSAFLIKQKNNSPSKPSPTNNQTSPQPSINLSCTQDDQCPTGYKCQAEVGEAVVCPENQSPDQDCTPSTKIIKGTCKLTEGGICQNNSDCYPGFVCHKDEQNLKEAKTCTNLTALGACSGPNDNSCPTGYQCIENCGPPAPREDEPPPGYSCVIDEIANQPRNCPICLASNTMIAAPNGEVNVKNLKAGMKVWSVDKQGNKIISSVLKTSSSNVPINHKVIEIVLEDNRKLWVSLDHPTATGMKVEDLKERDLYDGSKVLNVNSVPYWDDRTYDLLPDSETGNYFANGILMGSTLNDDLRYVKNKKD